MLFYIKPIYCLFLILKTYLSYKLLKALNYFLKIQAKENTKLLN